MPHELTLPSFAKVNLHLRVVGKRNDGFHELCTVLQTVSLRDSITFAEADGLFLIWNETAVALSEDNLIIRAANGLRARFAIDKGAQISVVKTIPSPGGLGGGSSNAAVTLLGLSKLWGIDAPFDEIVRIAGALGSDVPFFLYGGSALGTGRGEQIAALADIDLGPMLVVTPDVYVSTAEAYARLGFASLTNEALNRNLQVCRDEAESPDLFQSALKNDLEPSVFKAYPEIARVKETLLGLGAQSALMSGSGASVFAIFDKEETRQAALKALDTEVNWRKFAVAAVSREEYVRQTSVF